jgi:hypothetical protein
MSRVAASDPGGRVDINWYINENFPQVVGKLLVSMHEFTEGLGKVCLGNAGTRSFG